MKAEEIEQEFLNHINQAELVQSEDNLWTLGYRRPEDGEFRGCKDFFSMTSAMKYYHQSQLQALKEEVEKDRDNSEYFLNSLFESHPDKKYYKGRLQLANDILNLITNLEDNE